MEFINKKLLVVFLLVVMACTACGTNIIRGKPPFISIASLTLKDEQLSAVFNLSNQNGEPMEIQGVEIRVEIQQVELTRYNSDFRLIIDSNSVEEVQVDELPDEFTRELLTSLEGGEVNSLPFQLEGQVQTQGDGALRFKNKGYLYPVPGRPGQFRSATTHASKIDNEDPFREIDDKR